MKKRFDDVLNKYRDRMNADDIRGMGDVWERNTEFFINEKFKDSPTYKNILVESIKFPDINYVDARIIEVERLGSLREAVFRPYQKINVGSYLTFDDNKWLIFDTYGAGISPKSIISLCNRQLRWIDKNGSLLDYPCVASSADIGSKSKQSRNEIEYNKFDVKLPLGQLFIFVQSNRDTRDISLNQRFILGTKVYEVTGYDDVTSMDKDGDGLIQFTVKIVTSVKDDDFDLKIAKNIYKDSSTGFNGFVADDNNGSGGLWG